MPNFGALKNEVQILLIDTPNAVQQLVGTWVNRAIRKLQVKHNFKDMETETTYTTVLLTRLLGTRPTNWKQPRGNPYYIYNLGGPPSEMFWSSSKAQAEAMFGTNSAFDYGPPEALVEDVSGIFNVYSYPDGLSDYPDGQYRVTVPYWGYTVDLGSDTDINWFTDNATQWIVYQATAEGFYANEDEARAMKWEARARDEYKDVVSLDKRRRMAETQDFAVHLGARRPNLPR